jgi:aspartate 1-decarboxylase
MDLADLLEFEQVAVVDIDNGARLETYVIEGERGSGAICLNGAAARLVSPGDKVIIISYADFEASELEGFEPSVVHVDGRNQPVDASTAERIAVDQQGPAPHRYVDVE